MGHFIHACRRDLDITYIVFNNENYALTTGQSSPTTPIGAVTKTTPEGNIIAPLDPIALAEHAGCKFTKKAHSKTLRSLRKSLNPQFNIKDFLISMSNRIVRVLDDGQINIICYFFFLQIPVTVSQVNLPRLIMLKYIDLRGEIFQSPLLFLLGVLKI